MPWAAEVMQSQLRLCKASCAMAAAMQVAQQKPISNVLSWCAGGCWRCCWCLSCSSHQSPGCGENQATAGRHPQSPQHCQQPYCMPPRSRTSLIYSLLPCMCSDMWLVRRTSPAAPCLLAGSTKVVRDLCNLFQVVTGADTKCLAAASPSKDHHRGWEKGPVGRCEGTSLVPYASCSHQLGHL